MIKAIGNGVKVKGWEMIGWFGLLNYREAVSYIQPKGENIILLKNLG